ncbi:hypothetical protein T11_10710 [Trichinella zimbabwensis]|uniref:Uncharacterized protein n=1 Tax=Trichinella zimbabwensis TaxID=268475 RepID=A0A0V1F5S5_9BILA|nr:hypothetical protein T11_10710 [Trichinella zimbabwensis]
MRIHFGHRWPGSRPGKVVKNDFKKFLKDAQSFWLSLARQQAWENSEKRLFRIFEKCANFLSADGQAAGPGRLRKMTF